MTGSIGELQLILVQHGLWLDQEEAADLHAQANRGDLPRERFVEEVMERARSLTDDERRDLIAAGLMKEPSTCGSCGLPAAHHDYDDARRDACYTARVHGLTGGPRRND